MAKDVQGKTAFDIPADAARVVVVLPAGTTLMLKDGKIVANEKQIIAYK